MALHTIRTWLWVAVVALAAIAGTGAVLLRQQPPASDGFGVAQFDLVDQNGNPVDETVFVGHPSALFFGFTWPSGHQTQNSKPELHHASSASRRPCGCHSRSHPRLRP